ncbi:filopodin [Tieghemostelium lacteum]|uniref:Filopodin n=1 Tax=Tieghemostelium lacteum TaxID=361077 RepID=A0A152A391_TIELA|nr:filopodin [Tieghemostelium lacteum]|eukprot:KYR00680.1 filopodin [Tieghemostelium lacteum]
MSLSLKISIVASNTVKTLRFAPDQSVNEVIQHIKEKTGEGGEDHGLFTPFIDGKQSARWLLPEKTLQFYDINSESTIEYKKKHRPQKIKLLDETIKTQLIDESAKVSEVVNQISKKMGIKNPEEYSLMRETTGEWLNTNQILSEQGIAETELLILKKKFFFNDANIDRNDPVQLHLLYVQCRDSIVGGSYPTLREESINLAALHCQIFMGDFNPTKHVPGSLAVKEFVPQQWVKTKGIEKDIYREYKKLVSMSEVNAKYRYVQLCRSLKTYGMTSFDVKIRDRKKLVDHILGVTREQLILMLTETKEVLKSYPLKHIRRWAATEKSFTLDFGDHETEYLILHTMNPESISQLISGYIEIIMKSRRDATKTIDVEDTSIGQVEQVAVKKGSVTTSSTYSGYQGSGNPNQYQVSPSQQIPITDLKNALRATDLLIGELNSMRGGQSVQGQTFSRSFTTLTPQQYKHQLISHSNAIATAATALFHDMSNPPSSGGIAASQQNILKRAQIIMAELNTVGTSAKNAAYFPELASFSDEILGVATKISESMARLLQTASQIQGDHADDKGRQLAQHEVFSISALAKMMVAVCDNDYVTESSSNLLIECAKGVASAISQMLELGNDKINLIDDEILFQQVQSTIKATELNSQEFLTTTEQLASTAAHQESKKSIAALSQATLTNVNSLLTTFKSGDIPQQDYLALQTKVSDIMDSMNLVTYALDCVEQEQKISISSNGTEIGAGESVNMGNLAEEFASVANDLTSSIMLLRNNLKNPETIMESYKVIANNANRLINCAKSVASRADPQSQQRLFNSANAVFESVAVLSNHCKSLVKTPDNQSLHSTIMETAGHLQFLTQNMSADAGKIANITALRDHSKDMISHVSHLISTSRASVSHLPDQSATSLLKASKDVSDALSKLMVGIKRVVQDPKSESIQVELLNLSQKQSLAPMNLVSTSKRLAAKISDPNQKQALIFSSDAASQSVQRLMKTCENYKKVCGHLEIEEALEAFDSTISDLDTTEIAIQGGFLDTIPGQTREGSTELLMVSIKDLNNANQELITEIRVNPSRLGELVKNSTSSASQVALASKSLISVTNGKAAQKKLMAVTKQLMNDMEQLVRASRSVSTNPNDPGADLLLDAASQDVGISVASLVGAASHIDCKELEEASADITQLIAVKLHPEFICHPTESFSYYVEELVPSSKALSAAILQIVSMARNKNIKGLGASSKITASTITTLVGHCVNAIALADNEGTKQSIQLATTALGNQVTSLLDFAKARVANYKDPIYDQNLLQASKSVEDTIAKVIRSLGSGGGNQLCDEAIDRIIESTRTLEQTFVPDASGIPTTTLEMNNQQSLLALTETSKKLGSLTSNLVSQKNNSEHLGNNATEASHLISEMIENVKQVVVSTISSSPPDMLIPCKTILDNTAVINGNMGNIQTVITSARMIAAQTSQLLSVGKEKVSALSEDDEQVQPIRDSIIKATQQLAMSTSSLAKGVKALSQKEPGYQQLMNQAVKDIELATGHLLISTSTPSMERGINNSDFEKLLSTCRSVSTNTSQLITSANASATKPKDMELSGNLSESAISMSNAIKEILKVSSSMMPGVNFCEEAIEVAQRAISDLSSMSLSVAVGSFDSKNNNRDGVTHLEAQEAMVEITKSIGKGINELLKASRQSPEAIGVTAKSLSYIAPSLVNTTKTSLATTQDQDEQNNIVTESKNLGDSILKLAQASLVASSNPSKETYQTIVTKCTDASDAMNKLVAQISSGVNLYKDLDESIEKIKQSVINSQVKTDESSTRSYQEYKDEINNNTKDLTIALKSLVATDQSNLVQISTVSKDVANYVSNIAQSVSSILTTTSDPKIRDSIIVNAKQVVSASGDIIQFLKLATTDKNLQSVGKLNDNFKVASDGITRFLQSIKQGAIGEILSDAAIDQIRKVISDLDAYSLFAAAGQLDLEQSTPIPSGEMGKQNHLKNLQKDVVLNAKVLIVSGSQLVGSSKGTQENLGAATTKLAQTVQQLIKFAKEIASVLSDPDSQLDILSASKALSIACQQLVLAGKDAQRFKKDATAFRSLGKAAEAVAEAVGQFLTSVYTAIADAGKGLKELEKSYVQISNYHDKPENLLSNQKATPEIFAQSAREVAKSSIEVVTAYSTSQDELVKSSQLITNNVKDFISNSKGITNQLGDDEATKSKVQESVKGVTLTVLNLIKQVKDQEKVGSNVSTAQIAASTRAVAEKIQSTLLLSKTLPGGQNIQVEEEDTEDLEQTAENELLACVKSIEAATANLLASRPKTTSKVLDANGIAATIVDASSAIAKAVSKLVSSAAVAQSKRRETNLQSGSLYKKDPTWSNGLISASKHVAGATTRLVEAAIKSTKGNFEEEELIVTARQVAAATAQLVTASRAKSGDDPQSQAAHMSLSQAAKAVAAATSELVAAAKAASAFEEQQIEEDNQEFNFTGSKVKELEQQVKILKLEKELEMARKQMLNTRKQNYQNAPKK